MIKSKRMGWAGHVALMGESRSAFKILTDKPIECIPLGKIGIDWRNILKYILQKYLSAHEVELFHFRMGIIGEPL